MIMEGKFLQEILRKKGIKQKEVAELLGVSKQAISNMLNNTTNVKSSILERIADEFKIDIGEFFGEKVDEEALKIQIKTLQKQIAELQEQLKEKDKTINRLIGIIEQRI